MTDDSNLNYTTNHVNDKTFILNTKSNWPNIRYISFFPWTWLIFWTYPPFNVNELRTADPWSILIIFTTATYSIGWILYNSHVAKPGHVSWRWRTQSQWSYMIACKPHNTLIRHSAKEKKNISRTLNVYFLPTNWKIVLSIKNTVIVAVGKTPFFGVLRSVKCWNNFMKKRLWISFICTCTLSRLSHVRSKSWNENVNWPLTSG
jgi:hypothetical protein